MQNQSQIEYLSLLRISPDSDCCVFIVCKLGVSGFNFNLNGGLKNVFCDILVQFSCAVDWVIIWLLFIPDIHYFSLYICRKLTLNLY